MLLKALWSAEFSVVWTQTTNLQMMVKSFGWCKQMDFMFEEAKALSWVKDDIQQGTADGLVFPALNG